MVWDTMNDHIAAASAGMSHAMVRCSADLSPPRRRRHDTPSPEKGVSGGWVCVDSGARGEGHVDGIGNSLLPGTQVPCTPLQAHAICPIIMHPYFPNSYGTLQYQVGVSDGRQGRVSP